MRLVGLFFLLNCMCLRHRLESVVGARLVQLVETFFLFERIKLKRFYFRTFGFHFSGLRLFAYGTK